MARKQVNFRVSEEQRAAWEEHVNDVPHYDKLSDLIKISVRNQIERDNGTASDGADGSQTVAGNGRIDDILTDVEDNGTALERIEEKLTRLHDTVAEAGAVSDETASQVFAALPDGDFGGMDAGEGMMRGTTPSEIAEDVDISVEEAEIALAQLRRDTQTVQMLMTRDADEPVYWRED